METEKSKGYEIKNVEKTGGGDVMGDLIGCQFDSNHRGGYVYFWSSGLVGYLIFDYDTNEELIVDPLKNLMITA